VVSILVIALLTFPHGAPLRNPESGAIVGNSPGAVAICVGI
jgi:hypothetical protein